MTRYAAKTRVPAGQTRAEIEHTLERFGAGGFFYGWDGPNATIGFRMENRIVRLVLPLEDDLRDQEVRSRWRALLLAIKAKLSSVESGIETFEEAFLAHVVMPDNRTVGELLLPRIAEAYDSGKMPRLLLPGLPVGKGDPHD